MILVASQATRLAGSKQNLTMSDVPPTSVITIDGHPIEYRFERRGATTVLILHGGHMSARCRFGGRALPRRGLLGTRHVPTRLWSNGCRCWTIRAGVCDPLGRSVSQTRGGRGDGRRHITRRPIGDDLGGLYPELVQRVILMRPRASGHGPVRVAGALRTRSFRRVWNARPGGHCIADCARPPRSTWREFSRISPHSMENKQCAGSGNVSKINEFLLCCQSSRGFLVDLRAPTDVSGDVAQPTLILATHNDGAVSFDHAETLAATLRHVTLVEVDTPTHLLWLGEGSDRTAAAILSFIGV